jgi:Ca-activated chloride channel family protein
MEEAAMKNELNIRTVLSRNTLLATGSEQAVYALVDIKTGGGMSFGSLPSNFGLVLDRSGSMDGEKMDNLKEAVGYVVDHLNDDDLVSVTIFDDQVDTLIPSQAARNRGEISARVGAVTARGGTQISDGLKAGLAEVKKGFSKDRVNRILLLTDGRAWDDEAACLALSDEAGKEGISITSIGIGVDWNEQLLLQIAERSRGNSHWIENPIAILDAFRQEVEGMQSVAATNLRVTARMSPGVRPVKVYATVPMISDMSTKAISNGSVVADLGALNRSKGQALLIEVRVSAGKPGTFRLGQVEVVYDMPAQGIMAKSIKADLLVDFTANAVSAAKVNAEVMNLVEKVSAFKLQTRALTDIEAGDIAAATRRLQSAATVLLDLGENDLAAAAEKEIQSLKKTGTLTAAGTKKLEYGTRKLTQTLTASIHK